MVGAAVVVTRGDVVGAAVVVARGVVVTTVAGRGTKPVRINTHEERQVATRRSVLLEQQTHQQNLKCTRARSGRCSRGGARRRGRRRCCGGPRRSSYDCAPNSVSSKVMTLLGDMEPGATCPQHSSGTETFSKT